jgi:hypothetical protein
MNRKILSTLLMGACVALAAFVVPVSTNAQFPELRNQRRYSKAQVGEIIKHAEESSDKFTTDFRNQMRSNPSLSESEKRTFNGYVLENESALDRLRTEFNRNNSWWLTRRQVQDVINASQNVNSMMNTLAFRRNLERQWVRLRNDINTLADTYDLPGLNGGGWNGGPWNGGNNDGGWNGGGNLSAPPAWATGTFYSTSGPNISLTIASNGQVTVMNQGQVYYGSYYRGNLTLNGDTSTVRRYGSGIQTYNRNNGQTTNYSRNTWAGGGVGGGWNGGGNMSSPPNWAQGTFYSTNGGGITLTLNANGQVTAFVNGQTYYGTFYNGAITLNGDVSTVSRNGNGIRTYNTSNGQTTNYRRQ